MKIFLIGLLGATFSAKFDDQESDWTVVIAGGKRECYMQSFKPEGSFEIEYQVVDGGELDITFEVFDPSGKRIVSDVRQEDGLHNVDTGKGGDFQICLDNRFSRMTAKTVFFEIFLDSDDYDEYDYEGLETDDYEADTVTGLKNSLSKIKTNHGKTLQYQAMLRAFEAKDRSVMEHNYERVNFWSLVHLCAMVGTAMLQVYMLRSMFTAKQPMAKTKVST